MTRTLPSEEIPAVQHASPSSPLKDALHGLEERYRMPILLYYIEGYSVAETAAILRVSQGTVKTWLARGRRALKATLNEEVFEK